MRRHGLRSIALLALLLALAWGGGCATHGQTGALGGAGLGALIGQAIGHNTGATLLGVGVGAGIGYIIGNEMDKQHVQQRSYVTYQEVEPLANTSWRVVSMVPQAHPPFNSWSLHFRSDGTVVNSKVDQYGRLYEYVERYRVVGSTLILNQDDYLTNNRFRLEGYRMYLDTGEYSIVLERI